jgi:hypothetical protein
MGAKNVCRKFFATSEQKWGAHPWPKLSPNGGGFSERMLEFGCMAPSIVDFREEILLVG